MKKLLFAAFLVVNLAAVADPEAQPASRRSTVRSFDASVGVSLMGGLGSRGAGYNLTFGQSWGMGNFAIGYGVDFGFNPDSNLALAVFSAAKIRGTYYFLEKDISPFIDADFGFGLVRHAVQRAWNGGMLFGGGGGVGFFRDYDVHIRAGFRVSCLINTPLPETPSNVVIYVAIVF